MWLCQAAADFSALLERSPEDVDALYQRGSCREKEELLEEVAAPRRGGCTETHY